MRTAYVLTTNENSNRSQHSKGLLHNLGFNVKFFICTPNKNKVLSNKLSMLKIYEKIRDGADEWAYVFEDDINILEQINVFEIIQYEKLTHTFFYLGVCVPEYFTKKNCLRCHIPIEGKQVYAIKGAVRGLHAIGISKQGAKMLLDFSKHFTSLEYMDMILEKFSQIYPAPVIRFDLQSYIPSHRGMFFQDRKRFPSSI
jgi:hypothetical protein